MIIQKYNIGEYTITISKVKIVSQCSDMFYTFKIKTRINNKMETVGQSYVYYEKLEDCKRASQERLEEVMCIKSMLDL